mgnify:CR=1 FL=1
MNIFRNTMFSSIISGAIIILCCAPRVSGADPIDLVVTATPDTHADVRAVARAVGHTHVRADLEAERLARLVLAERLARRRPGPGRQPLLRAGGDAAGGGALGGLPAMLALAADSALWIDFERQ